MGLSDLAKSMHSSRADFSSVHTQHGYPDQPAQTKLRNHTLTF
jgi:hypothetical protein